MNTATLAGTKVYLTFKDYGSEGEELAGVFASRPDAEAFAVQLRQNTSAEVYVDEWEIGQGFV